MFNHEYVIKSGSLVGLLISCVVLAEKAYQHSGLVEGLWADLRGYKEAYDRKVMADAMVLCYGPQLDEGNIERVLADFRREISEADR